MGNVREEALKLLDSLPDSATWDDIMYQFCLRAKVEEGLAQAEADDGIDHQEMESRHPLPGRTER
jgi:hypothetical protein